MYPTWSIERQLARIEWWEARQAEMQSTIWRPTELKVMTHLERREPYVWDYTVITQAPRIDSLRPRADGTLTHLGCERCKKRKALVEFDRAKTNPTGYSFWCHDCRRKHKRKSWRDVEWATPIRVVAKAA